VIFITLYTTRRTIALLTTQLPNGLLFEPVNTISK